MKKFTLMTLLFLLSLSTWATPFAPIPITPDEKQTPGDYCSDTDKDFTEYRYAEKIPYCTRNVKTNLKKKLYAIYKVPSKCENRYTIDHLVPLALGGNNSQDNLWPEHLLVKATRQMMEEDLYQKVSKGLMKVNDAVQQILEAKTQLSLDLSQVDGCG